MTCIIHSIVLELSSNDLCGDRLVEFLLVLVVQVEDDKAVHREVLGVDLAQVLRTDSEN
jgi:hypothetical protein